jgi:ribose transport system ATP-binding protein
LRNGEVVAVGKVDQGITEKTLSTYMVGEEVRTDDIYQSRELGEVILELENLTREREFKSINLNLRKGEILGITGLLGDGRTELFASVCGANYPYGGKIMIHGKEVKMKSTYDAMRHKIAYVPKNRKENGIIPELNIKENLVLPIMNKISTVGVLRSKDVNGVTESYVEKLDIKVENTENLITSLSGGNQQKVVISKALCSDPQVLILDNPTQGVDIGAKMEIYRQIVALASQGYSFIMLTNEVPELQRTGDRTYVMFEGEIRQEFSRDKMTEENIMFIATGGQMEDE